MKILLIVPPWTILDIRAHDTQGIAGMWPPVGTLYIASVLREAGFEITFRDGGFYSHQQLLDIVKEEKPDAVGAFVIAMFWERTRSLFRDIKKLLPECYLFAGGHGPSAFGTRALEECDSLDAIVYSEGEYSTRELMEKVRDGKTTRGVAGTAVRTNGEIIENPRREYIKNLDDLPFPAMDLVEHDRYVPSYGQVLKQPSFQVISSRGCKNDCIYCYRLMGRNVLRMRSPRNVVDEIQYYVEEYGAKDIKFWDESFTYDRNRAMSICKELLRRGIDVSWWISARADTVDDELLEMMKKAGCWCINFGVESGVQKNLDTLRKNLTIPQITKAVKAAHRAGIKTFTTYIFGIPGETFEDGLKTIELAKKLNSYITEFFPISPFPGTDLWDIACNSSSFKSDVRNIGLLKEEIAYAPDTMSHEDVAELRRRAFREYYIRPVFIWRYLMGIRSWFELKGMFAGALTLLKFTSPKKSI
ncbi:B12-binding domain-containing radical SAM protein [bacterium]|nr:B12-binding domain-containing radical SAM protein [bacterium]